MARGFGTTFGVGTSDVIVTTALVPDVMSFHIHSRFENAGGGGFGRLFDGSNNNVSGMYLFDNVGGGFTFSCVFSGGTAQWQSGSAPFAAIWETIGGTYDSSSTSNDPTLFHRGSKLIVGSGLSEVFSPSGSYVTATHVTNIGNRTAGDRNYDGGLAEFAMWNVQLSDDEFLALSKFYSPLLIRPQSLVEYVPMVRDNVSIKRAVPTITGTVVEVHPRIIQPRRWRGAARAAGPPPPPETLFAQACL